MVRRLAVADALLTEVLLVAALACAFAHVVARSDAGLIPATLLGGAVLSVVAVLDLVGWRRLTLGLRTAAALAAAGLPLLLVGSLFTIVADGAVRAGRDHGVVRWTGYGVGYLLLAAALTQVLLLVLSVMANPWGRTRPEPDVPARRPSSRSLASIGLAVASGSLCLLLVSMGVSVLSRGGALLSLMFFSAAVVCAQGARLAWRR